MSSIVEVAFYLWQVSPDETRVAIDVDVEEGWHIYWENPGQSGYPTELSGSCISKTLYPPPQRFDMPGGIINYGYSDQIWLFAEGNCKDGAPLTLYWLACQDDTCVPGEFSGNLKPLAKNLRRQTKSLWQQSTLFRPVSITDEGWSISLKTPLRSQLEYFPSMSLEKQSLIIQGFQSYWDKQWKISGNGPFIEGDKIVVRVKSRSKENVYTYTLDNLEN